MDRKYKLLVASSLVSVIATGCSSYGTRGNADPQTNVTGSGVATSQQAANSTVSNTNTQATTDANGRTQQWYIDQYNRNKASGTNNGRTQQWYIDQYNREQAAKKNQTNTATNGRTQQWYIDQYNREQAAKNAQSNATSNTANATTNGRTQQWYIDRFNRQQAAKAAGTAYVPPKPIVVTQPYTPPKPISYVAPAPATKTQTQYVDYTGGVAATAATAPTPTNKNLYTGSYQQPNTTYQQYQPKTYTGGASSGSTNTYATSATTTNNTSGAATYVVKKGDTVFEVMRQTGVYWKEIISMNNLQAPSYTIQPGQALRLR